MKEGLDQRGTTTVLAADVCLHADREPASPGTTYADDICCIVAPRRVDSDIEPHTYI